MLTDGAVRTDSGKLFQIQGAAELKAWLATLCCLLAGKAGGSQMIVVGVLVCSHSTGPIADALPTEWSHGQPSV